MTSNTYSISFITLYKCTGCKKTVSKSNPILVPQETKIFLLYQTPINVTECPNLSSCWNFFVEYWYGCRTCFCSDVNMNKLYDEHIRLPCCSVYSTLKAHNTENVLQCVRQIFLSKKTAVALFNNSKKKKNLSDKTDVFLPAEDDCSHSLFPFT